MRARSPLLLASRTDPVESGALHTSDRPTRAPLNLTWQVPAEWTQSGPYTLLSRSHASLAYLACPSYPMPRRFSVSLTFSVLCLSMVSLLFAADDGRDRSRLLYGTRNATSGALNHLRSASLRDDEILRSFSLSLSSLLPVSFSFTLRRSATSGRFALFAGFAESRTVRKCLRVRYYLAVSLGERCSRENRW